MENQSFTITVKLTPQDLMQMNISYLTRQWNIWLFAVLFIFATLRIGVDISSLEFSGYTPMAIIVFVTMIAMIYGVFIGSKKSFDKFAQEERTYTFSEDDVYMESESTTQRVRWSDMVRGLCLPKYIMMFHSHNAIHLIPARSLTPEQYESIKITIKNKVKKPKQSGAKRFLKWTAIYLIIFLVAVGVTQFFLAE
ncbi:YcxB family protein [Cohnella soli]|uniref:YcxB family protein n=1 Tax=Cohnella soli TaxID=425005 RepID=A0ABW0I192_9BACL